MSHKIEILPTAWENLKKTQDYYAVQYDVETTIAIGELILNVIQRLEKFPDAGSLASDKWLNERRHRMVICKQYVVIYKVINDSVYIYQIADTQTEYTKLFY